jgi:hypothetical protein
VSNKRDLILAADDIVSETMTISEWGGVVIEVRSMTAAERTTMMEEALDMDTGRIRYNKVYGTIIAKSVYDPDTGDLIFTSDDIAALGNKNGAVIERIALRAMKLAGMTEADEDEAGNDSSATPTGDT